MSREYTFDITIKMIDKDSIDIAVENLIRAEKIAVGPDFYSGDYVLIFGSAVGSCYFPIGAIHGIDIRYVRDIVPTKIVLARRTSKPVYHGIPRRSGRYPWGTDGNDVIKLMNTSNKQDLIKDVIFNNPATIVYWVDGTKTVVKAHNEKFDPEKGLAMAICKRFLGSNKSGANFNDIFKKWLPEQKESNSDTNIKDYEKNLMALYGVPPQVFYQQERLPEQKGSNSNIRIDDDNKNEPLRWMTVAEVAEELGCSKALVQEECRKGLYPGAFKENGKWLIPVPLLEEKRGNKNE
jgi:hypothetical protein|nr:MAG TPA: helix-turn-helix domain protein [Caudoviricetes sp.]